MRGLAGQVAVVAGGGASVTGSQSMGEAVALRLGAEGCRVVVGDLFEDRARATAEAITAGGGEAVATGFDLAEEATIEQLISLAVDAFGGIQLLANVGAAVGPGSAYSRDTDVVTMSTEVWDTTLDVNLRGYVLMCKHAIPELIKNPSSAILCWSSVASVIGMPDKLAYSASKAGIEALVRHTTSRFAADGLRANAIAPGAVKTGTWLEATREYGFTEEMMSPYGRAGRPDEIAALAAFLLSDECPYIAGQVIVANGGTSLSPQ